jgi:phage terminase large subunit-like protein
MTKKQRGLPDYLSRQGYSYRLQKARELAARAVGADWRSVARPDQLPPDGEWRIWLILAGRGFGKTRAINEWALEQARTYPKSRGALVAATAADARDVLIEGESGILKIAPPDFLPIYSPTRRRLVFPNGSSATHFSADEPNRLRGPQFHWAICDELAAWRFEAAFDNLLLGTRLGIDPRIAIATTPRPVPLIRRLLNDPTCVITRGTTYDNAANLAPAFLDAILSRYAGTRLGQQEIEGTVIESVEGALWQHDWIEAARVMSAPDLLRVVIAVDPAVTSGKASDETGIVAAGAALVDGRLHGYILGDHSLKAPPDVWARAVIAAYHAHKADRIIAEVNNGGELVEHTIRTIDANAPITQVRASRGKAARAEPVAALYQQGRVHHVGVFAALEDQMCRWTAESGGSPDRVDALVWALHELLIANPPVSAPIRLEVRW